jgi:hypothetical protein
VVVFAFQDEGSVTGWRVSAATFTVEAVDINHEGPEAY